MKEKKSVEIYDDIEKIVEEKLFTFFSLLFPASLIFRYLLFIELVENVLSYWKIIFIK